MFPNNSSVTRPQPLPYSPARTGLLRRLSIGTMRRLRLPQFPAPPSVFSNVGPGGLVVDFAIRSPRPGSPRPARLGVVVRFHPFRCLVHKGTCGSPKFPENPIVPLPCSQTPVKPWCLAFTAPRYCPRHRDEEGLNNIAAFGALSHGLSTGGLRFVPPSLATTQNSLPGVGQPFPGGIPVYPLSSVGKFQPFGFPFPWALLGATQFRLFPLHCVTAQEYPTLADN